MVECILIGCLIWGKSEPSRALPRRLSAEEAERYLLYDSAVADRKDYPFRVLARVSDVHGPFAGFHDLEDRGALVDVFPSGNYANHKSLY